MTNILIFEDEPAALQRLTRMIKDIRPNFNIAGTADNIADAIDLITNSSYDLIFSDIELSDGNCFEVFEQNNTEKPIIFITAYNDYAVKAFNYNGIHYLLKPINYEGLTKAIVKFENNTLKTNAINTLKNTTDFSEVYQKRFISKVGNTYKIVDTKDIMLFYTDTGLVYAKTLNNQKFVLDETLEKVKQKVNPTTFFRINRQIILNINAVEDMYAYSSHRLKIKLKVAHHEDVIVSKDKSTDFKNWIASH